MNTFRFAGITDGMSRLILLLSTLTLSLLSHAALVGEGPALGPLAERTTQAEIENGELSLLEIRSAGLHVFVTPFNKQDGYGDGPLDPGDTISPGGRPTLQGNGTFLRVNGLDAQTCQECHSLVSTATTPFTTGIGGSGSMNNVAMFQPRFIDVEDSAGAGHAGFDGRLILPPALYGVGGVQLLAKEMTEDLQRLKQQALSSPGTLVPLLTKGISFGSISAGSGGDLNTGDLEGIDTDLVVRPFGRKGEFSSVRQFDLIAMQFHLGMQPVEVVGEYIDGDNDGVVNEVLVGEMSALEIFLTTQEHPIVRPGGWEARQGAQLFSLLGCADCHVPVLRTRSRQLHYSFPEDERDPGAKIFYSVDLSVGSRAFTENAEGGLDIPLFSDLKRHDLGPKLHESFAAVGPKRNAEFVTAKLWGVADTAPYLHDGRALTLNEAISLHGGEAQSARDAYQALSINKRNQVLAFLMTLRNPRNPNRDLLRPAPDHPGMSGLCKERSCSKLPPGILLPNRESAR